MHANELSGVRTNSIDHHLLAIFLGACPRPGHDFLAPKVVEGSSRAVSTNPALLPVPVDDDDPLASDTQAGAMLNAQLLVERERAAALQEKRQSRWRLARRLLCL